MRKIILSACVILSVANALNAQNLHGVIFANTRDRKIGDFAEKDFELISTLYEDIARKLNYTLKKYNFRDREFTLGNLDKIKDELRVGNGDLILFFVVSHGLARRNDSFPVISIKDRKKTVYFAISTLHERLSANYPQAQTILTISQACNNVELRGEEVPLPPRDRVGSIISHESTGQDYQALFASVKSRVKVTSSQRGKTSWTGSNGSVFTRALTGTLKGFSTTGITDLWSTLQERTDVRYTAIQKTMRESRRGRRSVWFIELL